VNKTYVVHGRRGVCTPRGLYPALPAVPDLCHRPTSRVASRAGDAEREVSEPHRVRQCWRSAPATPRPSRRIGRPPGVHGGFSRCAETAGRRRVEGDCRQKSMSGSTVRSVDGTLSTLADHIARDPAIGRRPAGPTTCEPPTPTSQEPKIRAEKGAVQGTSAQMLPAGSPASGFTGNCADVRRTRRRGRRISDVNGAGRGCAGFADDCCCSVGLRKGCVRGRLARLRRSTEAFGLRWAVAEPGGAVGDRVHAAWV
jgi:hypothetical protein